MHVLIVINFMCVFSYDMYSVSSELFLNTTTKYAQSIETGWKLPCTYHTSCNRRWDDDAGNMTDIEILQFHTLFVFCSISFILLISFTKAGAVVDQCWQSLHRCVIVNPALHIVTQKCIKYTYPKLRIPSFQCNNYIIISKYTSTTTSK